MTNLMRKISDAMSKVDTKQVLAGLAESKLGRDEKVVGTASEELLQLWGVVEQAREELKQFARRGLHFLADADPSDEMETLMKKTRPLMAESEEIRNREKAARQLFWASVKADFPETLMANVGIRKNGQIVTFEGDTVGAIIDVTEIHGLMDLLGRLRR